MSLWRGALALSSLALATMLPGFAQEQPQRHLVYNFTVGVQNDTHSVDATANRISDADTPAAGGGIGTGTTSFLGEVSDRGTISIDVFALEPDGGLVVNVSEDGQNLRKAAAVECVVYPTTNAICASSEVFPEELAVIRTLSPKFFDPSTLDAKHHWHQGNDAAGVSRDFTAGLPRAAVVPISENDDEKVAGGQDGTMHGAVSYSYDMSKVVSTDVKEYDTIRKQIDGGQYTKIIIDITAQLATDSGIMAKR